MKVNDNSQVEIAYTAIRDLIISFSLYPETAVSDSKLAKQLNISRAPVREAIIRLQMEGLINSDAGGKLIVAPISLSDISDILSVRKALEVETIRLISNNGWLTSQQEAHLKQIQAAHKKAAQAVTIAEICKYDDLFHSTIVHYSNSPRIQTILDNMRLQMHRARWLNVTNPFRHADAAAEHESILAAMEKHDLEAAVQAITTHIENASNGYSRLLNDDSVRAIASAITNFFSNQGNTTC